MEKLAIEREPFMVKIGLQCAFRCDLTAHVRGYRTLVLIWGTATQGYGQEHQKREINDS